MNKHKYNISQTKNYSTLFSTVSKTWPSGPECWPRKYGWFSSGRTKQISNPETDHLFTPELNHHSIHGRRSRALAQALPTLNRRWYSSSHKPAFTIIEVVLVLAIAGLIFMMVFVALPALQRNQRDIQRKQDLIRLMDAAQRRQMNNKGRIVRGPGEFSVNLIRGYLTNNGDTFHDPDGSEYRIVSGFDQSTDLTHKDSGGNTAIYLYYMNSTCDGSDVRQTDSKDNIAFQMVLESGGIYCVSN